MASAVAIARLIASLLPAEGEVADAAVRAIVQRKLKVSEIQFRAAVIVGRARSDFRVAPGGALSRHPPGAPR